MANAKIGLYALAIKLGPKILGFGLKLLKGLKAGKGIMAAASLGAYSYLFTWQFAVLILLMLFVHESGHIWAMKKCGLRTKGIYFIPFLGAAAVTDEEFKTRNDEQFIAIMGPVWGLGLSMLVVVAYGVTHNPFFAAIASWWTMINLFNLIPMNPLDGGRIAKSIAYSLHSSFGHVFLVVGFAASLYIAFVYKIGLFGFLVFVGGIELFFELFFKRRRLKKEIDAMCVDAQKLFEKTEPEFMVRVNQNIEEKGLSETEAEQMRQEALELAHRFQQNAIAEARQRMRQVSEVPRMNAKQILFASLVYLGVAALLFVIMASMNHIPGADAAMEVLKE